jgi:WD40 repeat protein
LGLDEPEGGNRVGEAEKAGIMTASTGNVPGRIFMSYRREDTDYPASWLYERLVSHFGRDQVFKDVDSIRGGDDFIDVMTSAVRSCDVLLALIGGLWLTVTDSDGQRRLDKPDDFVRLEIEAALTRNIRVIPILVGARMPRADELPEALVKLARRQAVELSPNRFDIDTQRLLRVLDQAVVEAQEHARQVAAEAAARQVRQVEQPQGQIRERADHLGLVADNDIPRVADAARDVLPAETTVGTAEAPVRPARANQPEPAASRPKLAASHVRRQQEPSASPGPRAQPGGDLPWQPAHLLSGHTGIIRAMAFSPDGQLLATGAGAPDNTVRLWEAATGRHLRTLPLKPDTQHGNQQYFMITWMVFSRDGRRLATSGDSYRTWWLWDLDTGQPQPKILPGNQAAAFRPDGRQLAVAAMDGTVCLYDPATGMEQGVVRLGGPVSKTADSLKRAVGRGTGKYDEMRFTPDVRLLATRNVSTMQLWDSATGERKGSFKVTTEYPCIVGLRPDGREVLCTGQSPGTVELRDAVSGMLQHTVKGDRFAMATFTPDGRNLATIVGPGVLLWDAASSDHLGTLSRREAVDTSISCTAFRPDGHMLAVAEYRQARTPRGDAAYAGPRVQVWV